jgi:hypothetical protein
VGRVELRARQKRAGAAGCLRRESMTTIPRPSST